MYYTNSIKQIPPLIFYSVATTFTGIPQISVHVLSFPTKPPKHSRRNAQNLRAKKDVNKSDG